MPVSDLWWCLVKLSEHPVVSIEHIIDHGLIVVIVFPIFSSSGCVR